MKTPGWNFIRWMASALLILMLSWIHAQSLYAAGPPADSNQLWLEITGLSNGLACFSLHQATDEVYEVWSKTNLLDSQWNIERELWPATNQEPTLFTVSQLTRMNLFVWARDWTGVDENANGLPDWWEYKYFGQLGTNPDADPDGDGLSNLEEYQAGTDPTDYYNGQLAAITIVSGNQQRGFAGSWLALPLTVRVTDSNAVPLPNAPLTFTVTQGDGVLSEVEAGTTNHSIQLRTGAAGKTSAWLKLPALNGTNRVTVSVQIGTNTEQVVFAESAGILPMIAIGGERIMELTTNGDVISWGRNQVGDFGDYTHIDSTNPVHVVGLTNIVKIASGLFCTLAVDAHGQLWAWGDNQSGQLGNGSTASTNLPVPVLELSNVVAIAAAIANYEGGTTLRTCEDLRGQIAAHDLNQTGVDPVAVTGDGTVWAWGGNLGFIPTQKAGLTNAIAAAAGNGHALALLNDGTVWAWGANWCGQLGDGTRDNSDMPVRVSGLSNIVAICAGDDHSLALDTNGQVWVWGGNWSGQLGNGGNDNLNLPATVLSNVVQIAAGQSHSLALDGDNNVWAWGYNNAGQLGTIGFDSTNLPMLVAGLTNITTIGGGSDASAAIEADGQLWQWGASDASPMADPVWSDEYGLPTMAPTYVDFYNGQPPNLTILNGTNQWIQAGTECPQPLIFKVTDTNGAALSNAPVSVEVITGDLELRTASGGDNYKGLRLTTDANGEMSLIGYANSDPHNLVCFVRVLAASRARIVEADFNEIIPLQPTINITFPGDGGTVLIGTNQGLLITVDAQTSSGTFIQEVDYHCQTNGGDPTLLGQSMQPPFSLAWTNEFWWTNAFVSQYTLSAVAVNNAGLRSDTQSVTFTVALDTYWFGIPDYLADTNGTLGAWQMNYFGHIGLDPNADFDNDGTNNLQEYQNGTDPNKISFSFAVPNQYVTTNLVDGNITILGGEPASIAVLVDDTNFAAATWTAYTSSNITVDIGTSPGAHDVWIGLRGRLATSYQTWQETTLILNSTPPTIAVSSPVDGVSFNSSRVNVSGNFTATALKQITVNSTSAFIDGTNFEARNVPLSGGANTITAVIEDLTGMTNAVSMVVTGITNSDGSLNDPVQLQAAPVAGFAPLPVVYQITNNNTPGTFQQAQYDFNGDDVADFATYSLDSITYTYETNGEYFPVVTIQTDLGRFSSIGGWNSVSLDGSNQPIRINVQLPATQATLASVTDPVDLKWDGTHLYVLSGSDAAVYEFATNGSTIRSLGGLGSNPSGLDVDGVGNVYVALNGNNQVWKFNPTDISFQLDTNFGIGGCIGSTNGTAGTGTNEFNAPYDVAVTPDGGTISVSDSGNYRIQQFSATNGMFIATFGSQGGAAGQFNAPKGLTYDGSGMLYITDSGNNRIVMAEGSAVLDATGSGGTDLGQFSGALNISIGKRGVYVADTGNGRIQKFDLPAQGTFSITSGNLGYALSSNLSAPAAVAAVDHLTNELFYVADTGHNRVLLCHAPDSNADEILAVWNKMKTCVANGDISGAAQCFPSQTADAFQQAFLAMGTANSAPIIGQIGTLNPVSIDNNLAQYYFEQTIAGQTITFPVELIKEDSGWKILEF